MFKNDFVAWYTLVMILLTIILGIALDGRPREGVHRFTTTFISLSVYAPIFGRALGYW